jgi:hypothetical protein
VGESHCRLLIQDIPGSMELELLIPTKDLAIFAHRLAEALREK